MQTYYSLLNLPENCHQKEVKTAYFQLIRQIHPDKTTNSDILLFHKLQEVWKVLRVTESRKKYDIWLREQYLREQKQLIGQEITLETKEKTNSFEEECRCGGYFEISTEDIIRIVDSAFFECSNCSLCLKVSLKKHDSAEKASKQERYAIFKGCFYILVEHLVYKRRMNTSNKVLVLGDSGVGKSTFLNNLIGRMDQIPTSTIGCNVQVFNHQFAAGTVRECFEIVELWDVSGSNVHRKTAANVFFDGAQGVIFVYDLSNYRSEENLVQWIQLLYNCPRHLGHHHQINSRISSDVEHSGQIPTLVVGTRLDLAPHRVKSDQSVSRLLQQSDCVYLDCRKEIPAGSTNRLQISKFFDSVVEKARNLENGNGAFSQQRRRRVI